jgi:catechol 2,3-dioxygenase-like lactoylglutathione lyase family enzyme
MKNLMTHDREDERVETKESFPLGWVIIWTLLALSFLTPSAKAQTLPPGDALSAATALRVPPASSVSDLLVPYRVAQVDAVGMTVADIDRSVEFFSKVLHFEKISDTEVAGEDYEHLQGIFGLRMRVVRMRLGSEFIELTEYFAPKGRPIPVDSRSNDRWFQHIAIITSNMEKAYAWLRQNKVEHASSGPQRLPDWNKNAGGIKAFYFKDPDGHSLEILQFPTGKGDAKWHKSSGKLFLGIDHTAIVVSDTEESLSFYRAALGMRVVGESENSGTEQEHLNNVFGARLRITALRAEGGGPGIEFLEYLAPRDGRPFPKDARANDLSHWQTKLVVRNAESAEQFLLGQKSIFVSSGVVSASDLGFKKGFLVRDPDGHVMQIIEK